MILGGQPVEIGATLAEYSSLGLEILGIAVIAVIAVYTTADAVLHYRRDGSADESFHRYRHGLIRGTLLGLELLVAADIIKTVAIDLTFHALGTLAAIVAIRTFLSFTLEVEMTGEWPWQSSS